MQCNLHKLPIDYLCFAPSCSKHLACAQCLIDTHYEHPESCLFLQDILNGHTQKNERLKSELEKTQAQLSNRKQSLVDLRYIQEEVLLKFDLFYDELRKHYITLTSEDLLEKQQRFLDHYKQAISLDPIAKIYQRYTNGELTREGLSTEISLFLNDQSQEKLRKDIQEGYRYLRKNGVKFGHLENIQKDILDTLEEIPKSLNLQKQIEFQIHNGSKSSIENGNTICISTQDAQFMTVSSTVFTYPNKYTITIKVEEYDTNASQQLLFGFAHQAKSMNYNYIYRHGVSAYFGLSNLSRVNYAVQKPDGKIIGDMIRNALKEKKVPQILMHLDIENKKVVVTYEDIKIEYSKRKCSKMFSGVDQAVDTFFNRAKKFVIFFYGSCASLKCQVI